MKNLAICLCLILLLPLSACGGESGSVSTATPLPEATQTPQSEVTATPVADVTTEPIWCAAEYDVTKTDTETGTVLIDTSCILPKITNVSANPQWTAINDYYSAEGEAFTRNAEDMVDWVYEDYEDSKTFEYEFQTHIDEETYEIALNTDQYASILRSDYVYSGGAHGEGFLFSDTFDMTTGERVEMDDLFTVASAEYDERIFAELNKLAFSDADGEDVQPYDQSMLESNFDHNCFYLTEDALVIFYQTYTIGSHALGAPEFSIPRDALEDVLIPW